ncbi:MAG: hypothetical protein EAZ39_17745 [Oscillatoriales cyanobacterium]|nr:MAG: hypothetical protein EAZ94_15195 [Oscillatoriales cyanobacterium]TAE23563.1 MAG: hypothetical protein EAZ93_15165 [Oscillatoriales cyanobacterium]TAG06673.1 MAG: hypothetical protein EAZ45_03970 [Oscillatoriales cyanobacterium]TAG16225.1 MAG: hypothetical protein EAZ39_17745 [Oscillatoriales cyanobacterium]TAG44747.1 MAG: hypothetical protein EAZ33_09545 [Oscillatoriales cyanobacterium]
MAIEKAVNGLGIYFLVRDGEAKIDRTLEHKKIDRPAISSFLRWRERLAGRSAFYRHRVCTDSKKAGYRKSAQPLYCRILSGIYCRSAIEGASQFISRYSAAIANAETKIPKFCLRRESKLKIKQVWLQLINDLTLNFIKDSGTFPNFSCIVTICSSAISKKNLMR